MIRWLLLWISIAFPTTLAAEKVGLGSLPQKARAAGFSAAVSMEGAPTHGYQPVYIDFTPLGGTFPRTRNLQVILSPRDHAEGELDFDMRHNVQLPQGTRSYESTVYVPYYYPWNTLTVRLFEDGEMIDTGQATFHAQLVRIQATPNNSTVGIISPRDAGTAPAEAGKRFPDVRTLTTVLGDGPLPEDSAVGRLDHGTARTHATSVQPANVQFRPIDEDSLHTTWLGYSQLDIILVASPVLQRIQREQPDQHAAIEDWIAAGGNLWIYAAGDTSERLFPLVRLTAPPASAAIPRRNWENLLQLSAENDTSGWTYNSYQGTQRQSQDYHWNANNQNRLKGRRDVFEDLQQTNHPFTTEQQPSEFQAVTRHGRLGAGTITTIAIDDPFPGSFLMWESVKQLHTADRLQWVERNGISVPNGNGKYWSFLIDSVGQPPVKSFILLNTLFVIAIGPVCYSFFRRRERLYLLFFFAPAVALLITGSLFGYALAADGIRTRAQTKTITWIDPHTQYACSETHHTYYSILSRRNGLRFPKEAMVSPVRGVPLSRSYRSQNRTTVTSRQMARTDEAQEFRGAFLPTRDQVQYMSLEPRRRSPTFRFDFTSQPQSPLVENPFPYAIERILIRDEQQQYWTTEAIDPGGEGRLQPIQLQSAQTVVDISLLNSVLFENATNVPSLSNWKRGYMPFQTRVLGNEQSQLDKRLKRWLTGGLPPKRFIAIAGSPEETLAVDSAVVVDDVHVLMGELP
jgi:hypothetical protein